MTGTSGFWLGGGSQDACEPPMSFAALSALRASAQLRENCHYVVNDYSGGTIPAGTLVLFHATSPSSVSRFVKVLTPYDVNAWSGEFDFDAGFLVELSDNLMNRVRDRSGFMVSSFDWGNPTYEGCVVEDGSVLLADIGNSAAKIRITVRNGGFIDLTGTTGLLLDVVVSNSFVSLSQSSSVVLQDAVFENATSYFGSLTSGTHSVTNSRFSGVNFFVPNRSASTVVSRSSLEYGTITSQDSAGDLSISQGTIISEFAINHGAGNLDILQVRGGMANIQAFASSVNIWRCQFSGGTVGAYDPSGTCSVVNSSLSSNAAVQHFGTASCLVESCQIDGSSLNVSSGNASQAQYTASSFANCNVNLTGSGGGGLCIISSSSLSNCLVSRASAHTGSFTLTQSQMRSGATLNVSGGTRDVQIFRSSLVDGCLVGISGTGDPFVMLRSLFSNGTLTENSSGGFVRIENSVISGGGSTIQVLGSFSSLSIADVRSHSGVVSVSGTNATIDLRTTDISNASSVQFSGNGGNRLVTGSRIGGSGGMLIASSTPLAANILGISIFSGTYQHFADARNCVSSFVDGGVLAHNGGTISRIHKLMGSTLTTGNFNHSGVRYEAPGSFTMSAVNVNRGNIWFIDPAAHVAPVV